MFWFAVVIPGPAQEYEFAPKMSTSNWMVPEPKLQNVTGVVWPSALAVGAATTPICADWVITFPQPSFTLKK